MNVTYGPNRKSAQDILDKLVYYTPEAAWPASQIGVWLGFAFREVRYGKGNIEYVAVKPESVRRAARRVMAAMHKRYPDKVSSCATGHFLIRTARDAEIDREFRRNHALGVLHNARRRPPEQPSLPLPEGW